MSMIDNDERTGPAGGIERHAQTVIAMLLLALLSWAGVTLLDVRERLTRIETRQLGDVESKRSIEQSVDELKRRVRDLELDGARRQR